MRKVIAATALAALLALPGLAQAKYEAGQGGGSGGSSGGNSACANQVLDMELSANELSANEQIIADVWKSLRTAGLTDELSANERIIADAWKSHLHMRKAEAFVGLR